MVAPPPSDNVLPERPLDRRLVELTQMVTEVAGAEDIEALAQVVTSRATSTLHAQGAGLTVVDGPGALRLVRLRIASQDVVDAERFPIDDNNAVAEAVRTSEVVTASSRAEIELRWPSMQYGAGQSLVVFPLLVSERCIGAIGLSFPEGRDLHDPDRAYLQALADCCAQTLQRIAATTAAADAAAKLEFLADASEALAASLDYEATLRTVADLAVPRLADWCSIDLLEDGRLRRVAVSHIDPAKVELAWRLWEEYPPDMDAPTGAPAVVRTGATQLIEAVDEALLDSLDASPQIRQLIVDLQLNSGLTAALRARGRALGVISFVYAESGRYYTPDDVRLAEDLARRAAVAIDNSQLHTETLQSALQLQRAILPARFADTDHWRVAVHYRPAGRTEVGGDFFDAVSRTDGCIVALVGDVMGRGISAAATMAQVRSAIRAFITEDVDPAAVIRRIDAMFDDLELTQLVTLVYAVIDPARRTLSVANAGHPPPLVLRGEQVEELEVPVSPPLGLAAGHRPVLTVPFGPLDTLVLYTDGLIERRGEDIADGLQRLRSCVTALQTELSDDALVRLSDAMRVAGHDDDVTVMAVRQLVEAPSAAAAEGAPAIAATATPTARDAELLLGAEADAVPRARRFVRSALRGVGGELAHEAELVVSELVTNAVLHGEAPIVVRLAAGGDWVRVDVDDRGRDMPLRGRLPDDGMTGRGLKLVAALSSRWGVDGRPEGGKTVWAHLTTRHEAKPEGASPELCLPEAGDAPGGAEATLLPVALGLVPTEVILGVEAHTESLLRELALMRSRTTSRPDYPEGLADVAEASISELSRALGQMRRQALAAAERGEPFTDVVLALPPTAAATAQRFLEAMDEVDRAARAAHLLTLATPRSYRAFRRWFAETLAEQLEAGVAGRRPRPARPFALSLLAELEHLAELDDVAERLQVLEDVTARLARATTAEQMAAVVAETVTGTLAVEAARVYVIGPDGTARSIAWQGNSRPLPDPYDTFPLDADLPGARVIRTGEPIVLRSLAEIYREFPDLEAHYDAERTLHMVPLRVEADVTGLLALVLDRSRSGGAGETPFVDALADALAGALARVTR